MSMLSEWQARRRRAKLLARVTEDEDFEPDLDPDLPASSKATRKLPSWVVTAFAVFLGVLAALFIYDEYQRYRLKQTLEERGLIESSE